MPYLTEGTIRKRKDNGRWEIRYMDAGKQKSVSHRNQEKCLALFKTRLAERDSKGTEQVKFYRQEPASKTLKLFEWVDEWYTKYKAGTVKESWAVVIRNCIKNHIKVQFANCKLDELNPFDIENSLAKIASTKVRKDSYDVLNMALQMAYKKQLIRTDIMSLVDKPKHVKENGKAFTAGEQMRILDYAKANSRFYEYFLFYFNTGCRTGEIYAVKKCDLDFVNKSVFIDGTKTKTSSRTIPLFAPLYDLQEWAHDKGEKDFLFTMGEKTLTDELRRILTAIGIDNPKDYTLYSMRHSFCTRLNEMHIDPKTISKWMGHANLAMTMSTYTHIMSDHENSQAEIVNLKYAF